MVELEQDRSDRLDRRRARQPASSARSPGTLSITAEVACTADA
jgi:hypothetical protein